MMILILDVLEILLVLAFLLAMSIVSVVGFIRGRFEIDNYVIDWVTKKTLYALIHICIFIIIFFSSWAFLILISRQIN